MSACPNCGHEERQPQSCPVGIANHCCTPFSGIPVTSDQPGERGAIADLCNHLMQVHNAGPTDAWWHAELLYPHTAREMGREAYEREGKPVPARYA